MLLQPYVPQGIKRLKQADNHNYRHDLLGEWSCEKKETSIYMLFCFHSSLFSAAYVNLSHHKKYITSNSGIDIHSHQPEVVCDN